MKEITINIVTINSKEEINTASKGNFLTGDIMYSMASLNSINRRLVHILGYEGNSQEKEELLKDIIEKYNDDNTIIYTTAYLSTTEFPKSEYYLGECKPEDKGKKPIPVNEILERESALLSSLGFIDVNFYTAYEYKVAFIYGNECGRSICDYWLKLQNDMHQ